MLSNTYTSMSFNFVAFLTFSFQCFDSKTEFVVKYNSNVGEDFLLINRRSKYFIQYLLFYQSVEFLNSLRGMSDNFYRLSFNYYFFTSKAEIPGTLDCRPQDYK